MLPLYLHELYYSQTIINTRKHVKNVITTLLNALMYTCSICNAIMEPLGGHRPQVENAWFKGTGFETARTEQGCSDSVRRVL